MDDEKEEANDYYCGQCKRQFSMLDVYTREGESFVDGDRRLKKHIYIKCPLCHCTIGYANELVYS